jgi:hypothetical protein
MPVELDFTQKNIADCLGQWKSEDEIWGDLTGAMRLELKSRREDIMEAERDQLAACRRYERSGRRQNDEPALLWTFRGSVHPGERFQGKTHAD